VNHIPCIKDSDELMLTLHCALPPPLLLLLLLLLYYDCSVMLLRHGWQAADADEASASHQHREWQQICVCLRIVVTAEVQLQHVLRSL
jgi:hypothetical protein